MAERHILHREGGGVPFGGEIGEYDFTGCMNDLRQPENDIEINRRAGLGHLEIQLRGIWEIDPHGLEEHLRRFRSSFAVRSGTFAARSSFHWANWPNPPVSSRAIARSSRYARASSRSAQATVILREAGVTEVVNLAGGMLRWRVEDHGAEGGSA